MILPFELLNLIQQGENQIVEFKKSTTDITKDVYESICAFSNRDGGHIFLGIKDNGEILGIDPAYIGKMKKDFVTAVNNANKMYPPLFLIPAEYELCGKQILYIYVPVGTQVCRCSGRIYDRNNESDIDITDNEELVYKLYARKQGTYFVNKVLPEWGMDVLRSDLIERARKMTRARSNNHPWLSMDDEELLRSAGLILLDNESRREGITLAAVLLFGKDITIMSVLPQHKTDMIFRIQNLDRYDDRDVIVTNLLDSYDRMNEFGEIKYFIKSDYNPKYRYEEEYVAVKKDIALLQELQNAYHDFDVLEENDKNSTQYEDKDIEYYVECIGDFGKGANDNEGKAQGREYIWCRGNYQGEESSNWKYNGTGQLK